MNTEQERKHLESALTNKSIVLNEGCFLLQIEKKDVNLADLKKQCMYGDAFKSAYSQYLHLIPTSIFLPEMFRGKNIFMEHKTHNTKVPKLDTFLPYAFLLTENVKVGHLNALYDEILNSSEDGHTYSEVYPKMKTSVLHHMEAMKQTICYPNEDSMLSSLEDTETTTFLNENEGYYTVIFLTQSSSVSLQKANVRQLRFGDIETEHFVSLQNNVVANFSGYNTNDSCVIKLSSQITEAIKRELLTFTQLFVGFEKHPSKDIRQYIENISHLYNDQLKYIECSNEENVESYALSSLRLYLSRVFGAEEVSQTYSIINDIDYKETIRQKILFQLLMLLDMGSCVNMKNLRKSESIDGKPAIVCTDPYTNPFVELRKAFYDNVSWLTHILTYSMFFSEVKNRSMCQSCMQKTCAIGGPSLLFTFSTNRRTSKKDRSNALLCFYTANNYNRVTPLGNLSGSFLSPEPGNSVIWEKHFNDLLRSLLDNFTFDLSLHVEKSPTTEDNIDERAENILDVICKQLDNVMNFCDQFCKELDEDDSSVARVTNVESEIKNSYKISNFYDRGIVNVLMGESLAYILHCLQLWEVKCKKQSVNDIFLKVLPLLLDNKSGFSVSSHQDLKNITLPKLAVKSYTSDGMKIDIESKIVEMYQLSDILTQVSFKNKSYLYGRYDENKANGKRKNAVNHIQNIGNRKMGGGHVASCKNSFLNFKNFAAKRACATLDILEDDYCRDVLNDIRDEKLDKYAPMFKYVNQLRTEEWSTLLHLIAATKMLEYLKFTPNYEKMLYPSFNRLKKRPNNRYRFVQNVLCDDFNKHESLYAQNCNVIEYAADISGKRLLFRKCSGKYLDTENELLNTFSGHKVHPGAPIFYMPFGEKNSRFKDLANTNLLSQFIDQEQFKLEKDVAYTSYIKKNRKQLYDNLFEMTFSDEAKYIESRYTKEILNDMMRDFDERFPPSMFANDNIQRFLKTVLEEYLSHEQSKVELMERRIKEIHSRVLKRKRRGIEKETSTQDSSTYSNVPTMHVDPNDERDDSEYQFLTKRAKIN